MFTMFEATEGGMEVTNDITGPEDLEDLYGWMHKDCKKEDQALVQWMTQAKPGTLFHHRLGVLVRLADSKSISN